MKTIIIISITCVRRYLSCLVHILSSCWTFSWHFYVFSAIRSQLREAEIEGREIWHSHIQYNNSQGTSYHPFTYII